MPENLILSPAELSVFTDPNFMPLKHSALGKIEKLLTTLRSEIAREIHPIAKRFPKGFDIQSGKLSRGENYKMYPYRVLDFPRALSGKNIFTFRSLVIWAHHCTFHLILAGEYKAFFQDHIIAHAKELPEAFSLSCQKSPWDWSFKPEEFIQARAMQEAPIAQAVRESEFIKITFMMPLIQYLDLPITGRDVWKLWQMILFGE